jgi:uncharacterized cupredoxin-like copper-binding protein
MKLRYLAALAAGLTLLTTLPAAAQVPPATSSTSGPTATAVRRSDGAVFVLIDGKRYLVGALTMKWTVSPSTTTIASGPVTFAVAVATSAKYDHELQIIKSDLPAAGLPVTKAREVDEEKTGAKAGEIEGVRPGDVISDTFTLAPGRYVLFCNVTGHYSKGMVTEVQVQ